MATSRDEFTGASDVELQRQVIRLRTRIEGRIEQLKGTQDSTFSVEIPDGTHSRAITQVLAEYTALGWTVIEGTNRNAQYLNFS